MLLLVTGCAGYIGSIICQNLIRENYSVIGIDNLSTGFRKNILSAIKFYEGDIADSELLYKIKEQNPDLETVIHLAGFIEVSESVKNPEKYFQNNLYKANFFLETLKKLNFQNIIYSSTAAVYGIPERAGLISESAELKPINPYGASKLGFEKSIQESGMNHIIFRFFNVAGADGELGECHEPESHLIPLLIDYALGESERFSIYGSDYETPDGTAIRDYIHVKDLAAAHLLALKALLEPDTKSLGKNPSINQIYNLGYGKGFSVKEIINVTEKLLNKRLNYQEGERRNGDPACLIADPEKALKILNFKPKFNSIETIISDALEHRKFWHQAKSRI